MTSTGDAARAAVREARTAAFQARRRAQETRRRNKLTRSAARRVLEAVQDGRRVATAERQPAPSSPQPPRTWTPGSRAGAPELELCSAMSRMVAMDAVAVVVALDMEHHATLPGSDARLRQFGDWQQSVSEGPAVELYRTGAPVVLADVLSELGRWPLLAGLDPACSGLRSLALLPLQALGAPGPGAVLGFLAVGRCRPQPFSGSEVTMLIHLAAVLYQMLATRLTDSSVVDCSPTSAVGLGDDTLNVALGMAMAAFGVNKDDAYARLKGRAFVLGCTVWELAHDLVTGRRSATVLDEDRSPG